MLLKESDAVRTRTLNFVRAHGQWTINGTTWEDVVRSGFTKVLAGPKIDDVEIWELRNHSGGWHHPAHPLHRLPHPQPQRAPRPPARARREGRGVPR